MAVDLYMVYMFMPVLMTLTLMKGHIGSAKAFQLLMILTTKQTTSIKTCYNGRTFFTWPWLWKHVYGLTILFPMMKGFTRNILLASFSFLRWWRVLPKNVLLASFSFLRWWRVSLDMFFFPSTFFLSYHLPFPSLYWLVFSVLRSACMLSK